MDVVALSSDENLGMKLVICTIYGETPVELVCGCDYEIGISVMADNSGSVDKTFRVSVEDEELHVVEMSPSLEE